MALAVIFWVGLESCEDDNPITNNPYDDVDYGDTSQVVIPVDSSSITGIHKFILSTKCANPGCHDGSFEPDFRSVQSSYSTMVYHKIIKNNAAEDFTYRVVPGDTAMSVLHERITNCCFVNVDDIMPQDNIGQGLPQSDRDLIAKWILDGAKDWSGQTPTQPSTKASVEYYLAFNTTYTTQYTATRVDNLFYNPFIAPQNTDVVFAVFPDDDETAIQNLQINRLEFSYDENDFSSPILSVNTSYLSFMNNEFWMSTVNTGQFLTDTTVFMRYTVSDGSQPQPTIAPKPDAPFQFKTYWSFIIRP